MAFKFLVALAFVAVASAGYIPAQQVYQAAPVAHTVEGEQHALKKVEEYDPHPQYKFAYDVQDAHTGDVKSHSETRDGDVVQGEYSLIDADGYKRIVQYTADAVHGFNAVVSRVPLNGEVKASHHAPAIVKTAPVVYSAPTVAPVSYAAPTYYKSSPVTYTAPAVVKTVAPVAYAAPTYYKSSPVAYTAPAVAKAAYAAPSYYKSTPVSYAAPSAVKTAAPVAYATSDSYVNSAQLSYGYNH